MPAPDWFGSLISGETFAYVGPGPGAEFTSQFNLLVVGGIVLLIAILLWPLSVLCRFLWARRARQEPEPADEPLTPSQESPP